VLRRDAFRFGQVEAEATPWACACSSQIGGLVPHEAGFPFGQIRTDASLQACAYSGRIVALCRVKRSFSSVKSRSTHRSRRAFTPTESWPRSASSGLFLRSNQDRRITPGVRLLRPNRGLAPRHAAFPSVTTISDRLGARAPKAIRA
jgi:hypothetical protein